MSKSSRQSGGKHSVRSLSISRPISQGSADHHSPLPTSFSHPNFLAGTPTIPEDYHHHPLRSPARTSFDTAPDPYGTFQRLDSGVPLIREENASGDSSSNASLEQRRPSPLTIPPPPDAFRPPTNTNTPSTRSPPPPPPLESQPKRASSQTIPPPSPTANHAPPAEVWTPAKPTVRLLFSYVPTRTHLLLTAPACIVAILSGLLTPYMTLVVGDSFDAFSKFPLVPGMSTPEQDTKLLKDIQIASLKLAGMGLAFLALHTLMSALWIWVGEINVRAVRKEVFEKVGSREMEWFDLGMGLGDGGKEIREDKEEGVGAAGLMSKFTRETDDIRFASANNVGNLIANVTSILVCLGLALYKSWSLTLVILSAIPVVVVVQGVVQAMTFPHLASERRIFAEASTRAERATASIATVKAFNAQQKETDVFNALIEQGRKVNIWIANAWGFSLGLAAFVMSAMFVAGFWFGSKLVREGKLSPGNVMTVFFATVLASNCVQTLMPLLEVLNKGKSSMVSMKTLINPPPSRARRPSDSSRPSTMVGSLDESFKGTPTDPSSVDNKHPSLSSPTASSPTTSPMTPSPSYTAFASARPIPGRKLAKRMNGNITLRHIRPLRCHGEFVLRNVTFAYPSRPHIPTLSDVSVFLPAGETTFIVGGSGSGKSTIAQLLLRLYQPAGGSITFDDQDIHLLDGGWMKEHVASVQQGCILFDMSVHDNVAIGLAGSKPRRPEDVTRDEVITACRTALMHDYIKSLPDGYETRLGVGGADLSGGQRQRLAIARAVLRNPTVLILDECTSALDAISRVLVFEAIKRWRRNQTTIVITHDLSQITPTDFVYLLKDGHIVEEGFRADLIRLGKEFSRMAAEQTISPLPEDDGDGWDDGEEILDAIAAEEPESTLFGFNLTVPVLGTGSASATRRPPSVSYFDILNGYSSGSENNRYSSMALNRSSYSTALDSSPNYTRDSWLPKTSPTSLSFPTSVQSFTNRLTRRASQLQLKPPSAFPSTLHKQQSLSALNVPTINVLNADQRSSWQAFQSSMSADSKASSLAATSPWDLSREQSNVDLPSISISNAEGNADFASELERQDLEKRGEMASRGRAKLLYPGSRIKRDSIADEHVVDIVPKRAFGSNAEKTKSQDPSIVKVIFSCVPSIPHKFVLLMAFVTAIGHGVCTPLWSSYLSKLMALVAAGGTDTAALTKNSVIVLCLSAADGLCVGVSFVAFEYVSYCWITELRDRCFGLIIAQDKSWFDRPENSPATIVQSLIKDGDDMLPIVATIPGHFITAVVMIGVGTIWAVTLGWKLTLIGVAVIPVFCVAIGLQFMLLNNIELRNKRMREEVAKIFYETVSNVRAMRSMALESIFEEKFEIALGIAYTTGLEGAWVQGIGTGLMNGMIYFIEALLFYMIAVFMVDGTYTYPTALNIFSLVIFSITFAAQMLSFLPTVAKAKRARLDFVRFLDMSDAIVRELEGDLHPTITGQITFSDVHFAYASRPDAPVLQGIDFSISPGECVAIVGASGSGKSTIAALLQRLYEPSSGEIRLDKHLLAQAETKWLREHISIVSQTPALFDATVTDNISYGSSNLPFAEVERACKAANVHEFILSLPKGYDTNLGESASLISGGQAQRIQIARALVKRAHILILDECTSALDVDNQAAVLETIMKVRTDRTVLLVTHKSAAMQMCSRILVCAEGRIVEDGSYQDLIARRGYFAELNRGGEWE